MSDQSFTRPPLVPVTVVAGYLGAGKTTLVNRLLSEPHGKRLGVLVNDFGAVNVDAALIAAHDGSTITLENGCVCCSIADSMGDALDAVLATAPDHIVVEASGVAEPAKIAAYGQGWPGCSLAGVLVLADLSDIRRLADDRFVGDLVRRQLAGADAILGTKADLLAETDAQNTLSWIQNESFGAPLVSSATPVEDLLHITRAPVSVGSEPQNVTEPDGAAQFDTVSLALAALDRQRLEDWLRTAPTTVARVKGIVDLVGEGSHLVQRVGQRWSVEPTSLAPTALVVIGLGGEVNEAELRSALAP